MLRDKKLLKNSYNANRELNSLLEEDFPEMVISFKDYEDFKEDGFAKNGKVRVELKQRQDTLIGDYICFEQWKYEKSVRIFSEFLTYQLICPSDHFERYSFKPFWLIIYDVTFTGFLLLRVETFERLMELRVQVKENKNDRDPYSNSKVFFLPLELFEVYKFRDLEV